MYNIDNIWTWKFDQEPYKMEKIEEWNVGIFLQRQYVGKEPPRS